MQLGQILWGNLGDRPEGTGRNATKRYRKRNFAIIDIDYKNGLPKVTLNMYQDGKKEPATSDLSSTCRDKL